MGSSILDGSSKEITTLILTVNKDYTIPETPSLSLFDGRDYGRDPEPKITVSKLEAAAKVTLYRDNLCKAKMSSSVTIPDGETIAHIKSDTISSDRTVTYYARQIDAAGNISSCSSQALSYTYDMTPPLAPSGLDLFAPSNSLGNDATPEITVSGVEENAQVELYSDNTCSTSASSSVSISLEQSSVTIEANSFARDGTVTYYARQIDAAGNISSCSSQTLSYTYDVTPPLAPSGLGLFAPSNSLGNDATPEITVSGVEENAQVELYSDNTCSTSASSSVSVSLGQSSVTIEANSFARDGTVTYYARQIDAAGNISSCSSQTLSYTYDVTPPLAPSGLGLFAPSNSLGNDATPEITVSGVEENAQVTLYSDNTCSTSASSSVSVSLGQSSVTIEANSFARDGTASYYALQTDATGNTSLCSTASVSYTYDATSPLPPSNLSLSAPPNSLSNDATPEIIVSGVEENAQVTLYSDNTCSTSAGPSVSVSLGQSSVTIEANSFTHDGTVTYYARQIDAAGNISSCSSQALSYTYDVTPPLAPSGLGLFAPSNNLGNDATPEITVSGVEENAQVELYSDNTCSTSAGLFCFSFLGAIQCHYRGQ